ncbi:MAG: acyltransferase family protein, partial [Actinocrinis sp.]
MQDNLWLPHRDATQLITQVEPPNAPGPASAVKPRRVPALDGLRALAIIAVLLYHAGFGFARGGFLGVDAFFVLSGFLITGLLVSEHEKTGRISLRRFYVRRARRLLPALFTFIAGVCLYVVLVLPHEAATLRGDALA